MYFVAKRVSLATVDVMLKREKEQADSGQQMYRDFSQQLNDLINQYFGIENDEIDMEVQIAGGKELRDELMPLVYVTSSRERANVDSNIKQVLKEYHDSN